MPSRPRRHTFPLLAAPVTASLLSACGISLRRPGAGTVGSAASADDSTAPRIDAAVAFEAVRAGRALLVDVRSEQSFRARRAAGAMLLAVDDIELSARDAVRRLPAGKQPILYCT